METRQRKGHEIAATCRIDESDGRYVVPSQNGGGSRYYVSLKPYPRCSCPDYEARAMRCKHIFAVEFTIERQSRVEVESDGETQTVTETVTVTATKRVTYKQEWPAYNAAQVHEKDRFQGLLADLCRGIEEPTIDPKGGRPPVPLAVRVFSAAFKVYSTVSCRRFSCDLKDAHEKGYISRLPHYNSVLRFLEDAELTPILRAMIVESSRPLRAVESCFAVDSSGFMTSRFSRWFDQKYGGYKTAHDWVKIHIACGVKTNVVTAVEIKDKDAADSPQFAPLVKGTAKTFTIKECSADKAYTGNPNFEVVAECGGTAYIPFKSNTTAAGGGLFAKMFHFFSYNRDEFLSHYHKRSNVESTFSMIKAKFGDSLRSKTDTAMMNESLCKILCHNVCCLISAAYELGIEAKFWGADEPLAETRETTTEADSVEAWAWV
jgi:transposase